MEIGSVRLVDIEREMRDAYLDYAMSVITSRALPDVRDGLKPVQRRILYTMYDNGLRPDRAYKKSAATVGDVLGKYHPHGDSAVYDAMVRLAQDFSLRYPLIDGQGNFGCFTGDTRIKLLDGTEPTLAELAERPPSETFDVYSVDSTGRIVVGEGRHARVTRRAAQLVELTFDDGTAVRCTPDHLFMLRDGSYRPAQELSIDDSLMAGYFDTAAINDRTQDYLRVRQPLTGRFEFVHHPDRMRELSAQSAAALRQLWQDEDDRRRVMRSKIAGHVSRLIAEHGREALTPELFRERRHASRTPSLEKAVAYFGSFGEMVAFASQHNHRVVGIRWLDAPADVYDITVDVHHNFMLANGCVVHNSIDGDPAAAYRYTEARPAALAMELLADIDMETVDFRPNFDDSRTEPTVMPARFPNLVVNGAAGIAVGMATNIPPHNLSEVCDGLIFLIDRFDKLDEVTPEQLIRHIPGPDFPTGAAILGTEGIQNAYATGRGRIILRAKTHIEELRGGKQAIVVTEIPYQVNKTTLIERIAELAREKKVEELSDLRDESDRNGMRIVIELKRGADTRSTLNQLFKYSQLQGTFGVNMLALVEGEPRVLPLKRMLQLYIEHRREVIRRRSEFELKRARHRQHVLEGLRIALANLDAIIDTIRKSPDAPTARDRLMKRFTLSEIQAQAILDMQLRRLAALERQKIEDEYKEISARIAYLEGLLADPKKVLDVIKADLAEMKKYYGDARRTLIVPGAAGELTAEDLIPEEDVLITVTERGYIKRVPADTYRAQHRGGRGIIGSKPKGEDTVRHNFLANTRERLLFFTDRGRVFQLGAHQVPETSREAAGTPLANLIQLDRQERVTVTLAVPAWKFDHGGFLVMVTRKGRIKRTDLASYDGVRPSGLIAILLDDGDELDWAAVTSGEDHIILVTKKGMALRFNEDDARAMGRQAGGVNAIRLKAGDSLAAMDVVKPDADLLVVTQYGYGKRSPLREYPVQGRYTQGVITIDVKRLGELGEIADARVVEPDREVTLISDKGIVMRTSTDNISRMGRITRGVRVMSLDEGHEVAAIAYMDERKPPMTAPAVEA
jgi:DNA gyrase subunit A